MDYDGGAIAVMKYVNVRIEPVDLYKIRSSGNGHLTLPETLANSMSIFRQTPCGATMPLMKSKLINYIWKAFGPPPFKMHRHARPLTIIPYSDLQMRHNIKSPMSSHMPVS